MFPLREEIFMVSDIRFKLYKEITTCPSATEQRRADFYFWTKKECGGVLRSPKILSPINISMNTINQMQMLGIL